MPTFYLDSGGAQHNSGTTDTNSATASGATNATCPANKTFASATDVNAGTDQVTVTGHGYSTGFGVLLSTSSALPGGLSASILYFLRAIDANTLSFYLTSADAQANTNIVDITSNGTGTQTITNCTVALGGAPNLSTLVGKGSHCRITTTGTSHVFTFDDAHGIASGDPIFVQTTGLPTGLTNGLVYYANALTTTTLRLYTTQILANAGGASTLNITSTVNNFQILYRADTHQYIKLNSSTVSGRLFFPIRYVDDTNDLVVLNVNITGLGAGSTWAIGGRVTASGCVDLVNTLGNGDTIIFNTDISGAINSVFRNTVAFNGGYCRFKGKAGARRVWTNTGNGALVAITDTSSGILCENLELQSQGTGNIYITGFAGSASTWFDCRFTDGGAIYINEQVIAQCYMLLCEASGMPAGLGKGGSHLMTWGCYFHDCTGGQFFVPTSVGIQQEFVDCIFERCASSSGAFQNTGQIMAVFWNCVFYRNDGPAVQVITSSLSYHTWVMHGCIFKDNGNTSTEYQLDWLHDFLCRHTYACCFSISGGRGGSNYREQMALSSTDITSDPLFNDPDNGAAANRDFSLLSGSAGLNITFTFAGSTVDEINFAMGTAQGASSTPIGALGANKRAGME